MFTGLIEEIGIVVSITAGKSSARIRIEAHRVTEGTKTGDSIAVNGLCLTAVITGEDFFEADIMAESLRRSSLGRLRAGSSVNLERAMPANGRFGGHIVSGHIDGTGEIIGVSKDGIATVVEISAAPSLMYYIVEKGSIAIDGISLTVMDTGRTSFRVGVIPHTGSETTLTSLGPGDIVNLETDIIAKYTEKFLNNKKPAAENELTLEFLAENGF